MALICLGTLKPAHPIGVDIPGLILFSMGPGLYLICFGAFLTPFFSSPENNLFRILIIDIFDYDIEKYAYRLLLRAASGIVVFLSTLITLSTILSYASFGIVYTNLMVTWPQVFLNTTIWTKKIMAAYPQYGAFRIFSAIGQDGAQIATPVLMGFSFFATVVTNVIAFTMINRMNTTLYTLCVIAAIAFITFTTDIMQLSSEANEGSIKYIQHLRKHAALTNNLYLQKLFGALRGCGFAVGTFYVLTGKAVLTYENSVVNSTIDALLIIA